MDKSTMPMLNDNERLLVAETERVALVVLTEDDVLALHGRTRTVRNNYVGRYPREAAARVIEQGARGKARPKNQRAAQKEHRPSPNRMSHPVRQVAEVTWAGRC